MAFKEEEEEKIGKVSNHIEDNFDYKQSKIDNQSITNFWNDNQNVLAFMNKNLEKRIANADH